MPRSSAQGPESFMVRGLFHTFSAILSLLAGTVHFPSYPYTVTYIALRPFPKSRGYGAQDAVTVTVWRSPPTFAR